MPFYRSAPVYLKIFRTLFYPLSWINSPCRIGKVVKTYASCLSWTSERFNVFIQNFSAFLLYIHVAAIWEFPIGGANYGKNEAHIQGR